jgi:hypothetical protein
MRPSVTAKELLHATVQFDGANEPIEPEVPVDEVSPVASAA